MIIQIFAEILLPLSLSISINGDTIMDHQPSI